MSFESCPPLQRALAGMDVPVLTKTIAAIMAEDMDAPVMRGVDAHNRPFVALKVRCVYDAADGKNAHEFDATGVFYVEGGSWWFGSWYRGNLLYHDRAVYPGDYDVLEKRLRKLVAGERVRSVDFACRVNSRPLDLCDGNGEYFITMERPKKN